MTNEELLSVAEIVEKLTDRFNAQAAVCRERCSEYDKLIASMKAAHEAKMVEHRAAFGARTEADAKIIAGLKTERDHFYQREGIEQKRRMDVEDERNGLLTQVQDMRAEIERLRVDEREADLFRPKDLHLAELYQAGVVLRAEVAQLQSALNALQGKIREMAESLGKSLDERDALRAKVDLLTTLRPKYKVGDKLESYSSAVTIVGVRTVYDCQADGAEYPVGHSEDELKERYEQTAYHDTEAGKSAAESAVKTEPVAEEIKVGRDVRKVTT